MGGQYPEDNELSYRSAEECFVSVFLIQFRVQVQIILAFN